MDTLKYLNIHTLFYAYYIFMSILFQRYILFYVLTQNSATCSTEISSLVSFLDFATIHSHTVHSKRPVLPKSPYSVRAYSYSGSVRKLDVQTRSPSPNVGRHQGLPLMHHTVAQGLGRKQHLH